MAFEVYDRVSQAADVDYAASVTKSGNLNLNVNAYRALTRKSRCMLIAFDRENNLIQLTPAKEDDARAYKINVSIRSLAVGAPLKFWGIVPAQDTIKYTARMVAGRLYVDLNMPQAITTKQRVSSTPAADPFARQWDSLLDVPEGLHVTDFDGDRWRREGSALFLFTPEEGGHWAEQDWRDYYEYNQESATEGLTSLAPFTEVIEDV